MLASIGGYLLWLLYRSLKTTRAGAPIPLRRSPRTIFLAGILVAAGALIPLVPWTLRNLHTLHRFQPLAPRYATDSDDIVLTGFNRWVKTWMADYVSVQEIYWSVPEPTLTSRACPTAPSTPPSSANKPPSFSPTTTRPTT